MPASYKGKNKLVQYPLFWEDLFLSKVKLEQSQLLSKNTTIWLILWIHTILFRITMVTENSQLQDFVFRVGSFEIQICLGIFFHSKRNKWKILHHYMYIKLPTASLSNRQQLLICMCLYFCPPSSFPSIVY